MEAATLIPVGPLASLEVTCRSFSSRARWGRRTLDLLVLGAQHHGKSSFVNHLNRCLRGDAELPDELETAPPGTAENTYEVKTIKIPLGTAFDFTFCARDMPATSSMSEGNGETFREMLDKWVPEGARRRDIRGGWIYRWIYGPADCAVICVSLLHWQSARSEVSDLLKAYARELKHASHGTVSFPYVVALTKRDEFEHDCERRGCEDPQVELERIKQEVRESANAQNVFALANMMQGGPWVQKDIEETFRLLANLVNFAKNRKRHGGLCDTITVIVVCFIITVIVFRLVSLLRVLGKALALHSHAD